MDTKSRASCSEDSASHSLRSSRWAFGRVERIKRIYPCARSRKKVSFLSTWHGKPSRTLTRCCLTYQRKVSLRPRFSLRTPCPVPSIRTIRTLPLTLLTRHLRGAIISPADLTIRLVNEYARGDGDDRGAQADGQTPARARQRGRARGHPAGGGGSLRRARLQRGAGGRHRRGRRLQQGADLPLLRRQAGPVPRADVAHQGTALRAADPQRRACARG